MPPISYIPHIARPNYVKNNEHTGKIGWGMDRPHLAQSPERRVIDGVTPHATQFDVARTHEFMFDRGSSGNSVNQRLLLMAKSTGKFGSPPPDFLQAA